MPTPFARALMLAAAVLVSVEGRAAAQSTSTKDAEKSAVSRQLLEATHAADQIVEAIEATVPVQRASNPRIPAVFWDRFLAQARKRRGEFVDSLVPLYNRTFELAELKALLDFYRSPIGKRLIAAQPGVMRESMQLGQRWGARIGGEIGQQLAAEGVQMQP